MSETTDTADRSEKVRFIPLNDGVSDEYDGEYKDEALKAGYEEYVDAVYGFNEISEKKNIAEKDFTEAKTVLNEHYEITKRLKASIAANRTERETIYTNSRNEQENKWNKERAELEVRIEQGTKQLTRKYDGIIQEYTDIFHEKRESFSQRYTPIKQKKENCLKELKDREEERASIEDFTPQYIPPANADVQTLLLKHRERGFFTPAQNSMLDETVADFTSRHKNIKTLEDVKKEEKSFANSDWLKNLKSGKITRSLIHHDAIWFSGIVTFICANIMLISKLAGGSGVGELVRTLMICILFGEVFLLIARYFVIRTFFDNLVREKKVLIAAAALMLGMILGCAVYVKTSETNRHNNALAIMTLLALPCAFLLIRTGFLELVDPRLLNKIPFVKNQSRKRMYKVLSKEKTGSFNAQLYLYINHNAVVNFINIDTHEKEKTMLNEKITVLKKTIKQLNEQINVLKPEYAELKELRLFYQNLIIDAKKEKARKINDLEDLRNEPTPDFDDLIPVWIKERIKRLDAENEKMTLGFNEKILTLKQSFTDYNAVKSINEQAQKEYGATAAVLKVWNNTPLPSQCGYMLKDSFCFESSSSMNVIRFGLEPFVFFTRVSSADPSKLFKKTIFRCIRGLVKINPKALIQVNIIDPISDPAIIKGEDRFFTLCSEGIVSGIGSTDEFEIRLFTSEKRYKTFRALFNSQCFDVKDIFDTNKSSIPQKTRHDLVLANKLKNSDEEPFMYQVMMFVVPRRGDRTEFSPPKDIVSAIKCGTYLDMGLVPFFFAEKDNIREDWQEIVSLCPKSCEISGRRK